MLSLKGKIEKEVEVKCEADEVFTVFSKSLHQMPNMCPKNVKSIDLLKGKWDAPGSVKNWNVTLNDGSAEMAKETVEAVDEKNRTIIFNGLDGDFKKLYKSIRATLKVEAKGKGCVAKWRVEYEKANDKVPPPDMYMDIVVNMMKGIEANLKQ